MTTETTERARLEASERACDLLVALGRTDLTVAEMARGIDLAERTFYRYFPTKQDALKPVFDWGSVVIAEVLDDRTDLSLDEALVVGMTRILGGERAARTTSLFPLVLLDDAFRAILLQALHDGEEYIRPAIGRRLGLSPESSRVRVAAASVVALTHVALEVLAETGADVVETFQVGLRELALDPLGSRTLRRGRSTTP